MPRVTVIVPNYNHARYLDRRLGSILGQTFRDFELLFLDDASTDESRRVFSTFASDPRVRALFNDRNSGSTFRQWNRGLREARGEYVWIAESDDYANESLLETLVKRLDERPQTGLAYCRSWVVDQAGQIKELYCQPDEKVADRWTKDFDNDGRDECARYLFHYNTIPNASAVLFRRSVCEQVGLAPEGMKVCGDWMFWARLLLASHVSYVSVPLNYYRTHNNSVRSKTLLSGIGLEEEFRARAFIAGALRLGDGILAPYHLWRARIILNDREYSIPWSRRLRIMRYGIFLDRRFAGMVTTDAIKSALGALRLDGAARALKRMAWRAKPLYSHPSPRETDGHGPPP